MDRFFGSIFLILSKVQRCWQLLSLRKHTALAGGSPTVTLAWSMVDHLVAGQPAKLVNPLPPHQCLQPQGRQLRLNCANRAPKLANSLGAAIMPRPRYQRGKLEGNSRSLSSLPDIQRDCPTAKSVSPGRLNGGLPRRFDVLPGRAESILDCRTPGKLAAVDV